VTKAGGAVTHTGRHRVRAAVPASALLSLARQPGVTEVRRPDRAYPLGVTSEGAAASGADNWIRDGKTGAGVKVGVVDVDFDGLADAQDAGELPASGPGLALNGANCPTDLHTPHGTAVAEVVHDMAPAASLLLACAPDSVTFAAAADWLRQQGAQVVIAAVGFANTGRGDGSGEAGSPADVVRVSRQAGVLWVTAAGNAAQLHWSGNAVDANGNGYVEISGTAESNGFSLPAGGTTEVALRWDGWPTTRQDLDLVVMGRPHPPTGPTDPDIVARSTRAQADSPDPLSPTEAVRIENTGGDAQQYYIFLPTRAGYPGTRADLFVLGHASSLQYAAVAGSVLEPASSPYAMAVAASRPGSGRVEDYSSQGPSIDGRTKPDLTGFDAVSTLTYGSATSGPGFGGTSAAAAHVAGAVALLKGANPALDASQLQAILEERASPSRLDNQWGHGLLALGPPAIPQPPQSHGYTPLAIPRRLLDTTGSLGGHNRPLAAGEVYTLAADGVPGDAAAVVVNVTASSDDRTHVDLYRDAESYTGTSTVELAPGERRNAMAFVTVDAARSVRIRNAAGNTHVAVDLLGYFSPDGAGVYTPKDAPQRILDTRSGTGRTGPLEPGEVYRPRVRGVAGVPDTATAVLANITTAEATIPTRVDVYGQDRPSPYTTIEAVPDHVRANLVLTAIGQDGTIGVRNDNGRTHVAVDIVGWFAPGSGARYVALPRTGTVLNTRTGTGAQPGPIGPADTATLQVSDVAGVPHNATAVALAASGGGDRDTWLSAGPDERGWSGLPSVDGIDKATTVAGPVVARLGPTGRVRIRNDAGGTHLTVAVAGYFVGGPALAEDTSSCRLDAEAGFTPLYDGRSPQSRSWLTAGTGSVTDDRCETWATGNAAVRWYAEEPLPATYTLRLDWQASTQSADSGVFVGFPAPGDDGGLPGARGIEIQIRPSGAGTDATGAIAGLKAPSANAERPAGQWNTYEITMADRRVTVRLNGTLVNDYTVADPARVVSPAFVGIQGSIAGQPVRFRNIRVQVVPASNTEPFTFADIDGDGRDEIIAIDPNGNIRAFRNVNGLNGFPYTEAARIIGTGFLDASRVRFADIDGDGRAELINIDPNGDVRAWRNVNGLGGFPYPELPRVIGTGWYYPKRVRFGDIDGDRRAEIISVDANASGDVRAFRNVNGLGGFPYTEAPRVIGTGWHYPKRVRFADIDGDRRAEIISVDANASGDLRAFRNINGLGGFPYTEAPRIVGTGWYDIPRVRFADIDGDGRAELISFDTDGRVRAWRNVNGRNGFPYPEAPQIIGTGWR